MFGESSDGRPPASPNIHFTTKIVRVLVEKVMQDE